MRVHDNPLYAVWSEMKARCSRPSCKGYKYYGARGIQVCERWRNSFAAFVEDMGPRPDDYQIERLDNDGNYEPGNCCWATRATQLANRRDASWFNRNKTHCPRGHEYSLENTRYQNGGQRYCRECNRIRSRNWKRKFVKL